MKTPGPNGGEWRRHQFRTVGIHGEFVSDCGEWIVDVNHDGAPDLVTAGWITNGLFWYENPKKPDAMWKRHFIPTATTLRADGWPTSMETRSPIWCSCIIAAPASFGSISLGAQPKVHHPGGQEQDGHGVGVADIDGDGKPDILTPYGWLKNLDADKDQWEWHPAWTLGETGFPIIGYDVNHDGKIDVLFGRGHSYGLYWLEQQGEGINRHWIDHRIDESYSQVHALALADIDGDGEPELLAGKRYRGHNGGDPGSHDPIVVYYYKINRHSGEFVRHTLSANGTAGAGTQFVVRDLDGDGDVDIATAGKTGVHFFENLKINKCLRRNGKKNWRLSKSGRLKVRVLRCSRKMHLRQRNKKA